MIQDPAQTITQIAADLRQLPELDQRRYWQDLARLAQEQDDRIRDEIAHSFGPT